MEECCDELKWWDVISLARRRTTGRYGQGLAFEVDAISATRFGLGPNKIDSLFDLAEPAGMT